MSTTLELYGGAALTPPAAHLGLVRQEKLVRSFAVIGGKSRYSAPTRRAPSLQVGITSTIAATGAYLLLTSIALTESFAWSPVFQTPGQAASGFGDSTQVLRSEPAAETQCVSTTNCVPRAAQSGEHTPSGFIAGSAHLAGQSPSRSHPVGQALLPGAQPVGVLTYGSLRDRQSAVQQFPSPA